MLNRAITLHGGPATTQRRTALEAALEAVRAEAGLPDEFPTEVLAEAEQAAGRADLPQRDETGVPFLTIDPPDAMDLDQALHIERHIDRHGDGYRLRYAIADVPAFVAPGGAVDTEARERGQTIYAPDARTPLHPPVLSEGAASLLPGADRPAYVWDLVLDSDGEHTSAEVYRAMVRSRQRYDYHQVQRQVTGGTANEVLVLLREVGELRIARELERSGASLPMPEQEVSVADDGTYSVGFRPIVPAEDWNAQISLLTGMVAAEMMLHGRVGILRTMPQADHRAVNRFRREARALGVPWPAEVLYGEFLRTLDRADPTHLALVHEATILFRGAGYTPFEGDVPEQTLHSAIAAPYAHVTAPLRRLVDRFALVVCESLSAGNEVPDWVRQALPELPGIMARADQLAGQVERASTDAVEAAELSGRVGREFDALVVDELAGDDLLVQVQDPAVVAVSSGPAGLGTRVRVRLTKADIATRSVRFEVVDAPQG